MLRRVRNFGHHEVELASILPSCHSGMFAVAQRHQCSPPAWRAPKNYRLVCDCQQHATGTRLVRQTAAVARSAAEVVRQRSTAFLIAVPIAFGALFPIEAMNLAENIVKGSRPVPLLHIVTPQVRRQFLSVVKPSEHFSLEIAKEEFFRTEVPFGALIYAEARRNNLPPDLVAAVVEAESDFRPHLRSDKHALGLMQLVPETGRLMGARDLFDPKDNLRAGTRYLRYLSDRYDGDLRMILAAYNAGEGNVSKFGGIPPFRETHDYLSRVSTSRRIYQRRLTQHFIASSRLRVAMARQ